jgi:hypothetical protein
MSNSRITLHMCLTYSEMCFFSWCFSVLEEWMWLSARSSKCVAVLYKAENSLMENTECDHFEKFCCDFSFLLLQSESWEVPTSATALLVIILLSLQIYHKSRFPTWEVGGWQNVYCLPQKFEHLWREESLSTRWSIWHFLFPWVLLQILYRIWRT